MKRYLTWNDAVELIESHTEETSSPALCAEPLVSVSLVIYQQRELVGQAIESILAQKTNFPFEILLGDDGSTDGTFELLREYQEKFPEKIRLFRSVPNLGQYTKNGRLNLIRNLKACRGRYIACLEGDDYWTCTEKLQRQADVLEADDDYGLCVHNVEMVWEDSGEKALLNEGPLPDTLTLRDMVGGYVAQTGSFLLRNDLAWIENDWFVNLDAVDNAFRYKFAAAGKVRYFDEAWSVWRRRGGTATQGVLRDSFAHFFHRLAILVRLGDLYRTNYHDEMKVLFEQALPIMISRSTKYYGFRILARYAKSQWKALLRSRRK